MSGPRGERFGDGGVDTLMNEVGDPMRTIYDAILRVEQAQNATNLTIGGVRVWSALRYQVFEQVLIARGITGRFQTKKKKAYSQYAALCRNVLLRNPFFPRKCARYLIVKWDRLTETEDGPEDLISLALRHRLPPEDTLELDVGHNVSAPGPRSRSMLSIELLTRLGARLYPSRLSPQSACNIDELEEALRAETGVTIPLRNWFTRFASEFRVQRKLFEYLIQKSGIKIIFVVVAYFHTPLIAAARNMKVKIVELQHGLIHNLHLGYGPGAAPEKIYAPDDILLFGSYWQEQTMIHPETRLSVYGAPYLRNRIEAAISDAQGKGSDFILFISQPAISNSLLDFVFRFVRQPGAPKVIYRLHPGDDKIRIQQRVIDAGLSERQFELSISSSGADTLALQANARAQVGVYSTAIAEGLALGCQTILVPLAGWTSLGHFVDAGYAQLARTPEELLATIKKSRETTTPFMEFETLCDRLFARERPEALSEFAE